jgi:hypothetical protein
MPITLRFFDSPVNLLKPFLPSIISAYVQFLCQLCRSFLCIVSQKTTVQVNIFTALGMRKITPQPRLIGYLVRAYIYFRHEHVIFLSSRIKDPAIKFKCMHIFLMTSCHELIAIGSPFSVAPQPLDQLPWPWYGSCSVFHWECGKNISLASNSIFSLDHFISMFTRSRPDRAHGFWARNNSSSQSVIWREQHMKPPLLI